MNLFISIVVGVLVGWIASSLNPEARREDLIRNITAAVAGAFIGLWLLGTILESGQSGFSLGAIAASVVGATAILLLLTRFYRA